MATEIDSTAILYDAGLVGKKPSWTTLSWSDTNNQMQQIPADLNQPNKAQAVKYRTLIGSNANGSLAVFPEPRHGADGTVGLGCVFLQPAGSVPMRQESQHGLARFNVQSGQPLVYYSGGAWDKAGRITSAEAWLDYLKVFTSQLNNPPGSRWANRQNSIFHPLFNKRPGSAF